LKQESLSDIFSEKLKGDQPRLTIPIMDNINFESSSGHQYATISFNEEAKCPQDIWRGSFGTQGNFQKVLIKLIDVMEDTKSSKLLTDVSQMVGSFDSSREWIVQENIPKLIRNGLRHHAVVIPKNIFSKLSVKDYSQQVAGLEIMQFGDREEAIKWLKSRVMTTAAII
jgi:hypothetical protein